LSTKKWGSFEGFGDIPRPLFDLVNIHLEPGRFSWSDPPERNAHESGRRQESFQSLQQPIPMQL
jgi:hypothetical protein